MPEIQIRITGSRDAFDNVVTAIHGIDGVSSVEEIDDFGSDIRDDSSSSELSDDVGSRFYVAKIHVNKNNVVEDVEARAEMIAAQQEAVIEFIDDDENEI